jgi:hypothetical protein
MALAWNAGWVNALRGSNPLSSATEVPVSQSLWAGTSCIHQAAFGLQVGILARSSYTPRLLLQVLPHPSPLPT